MEIVITSAVGCVLPFSEKAVPNSDISIGLEGFDWEQRTCDVRSSGLRIVSVGEGGSVTHEFKTLDSF